MVDMRDWTPTQPFDDFASTCCHQPHLSLLTDPESFSLTQRMGRIGPVTLSELVVGSEMWISGGEHCSTYRVLVFQSGHMEFVHRGLSVAAGVGTAAVYAPEGLSEGRWTPGSSFFSLKSTAALSMKRSVVHSAARLRQSTARWTAVCRRRGAWVLARRRPLPR
jgi:AraC-binding-like domain